jgi:hypothetical protein
MKDWFKALNLKDGKIDKESLVKFYNYLREKSRVKLTITAMPDPRKVALNKAKFEETLNLLIEAIYKKYPELNL